MSGLITSRSNSRNEMPLQSGLGIAESIPKPHGCAGTRSITFSGNGFDLGEQAARTRHLGGLMKFRAYLSQAQPGGLWQV